MSLEQFGTIFAIVTSIASVIYLAGFKLAKLEVKVDTMWGFMLDSGRADAVIKGLATKNSPFRINDIGKAFMAPLATDLRKFYSKFDKSKSDYHLAYQIQQRFGQRMLDEVCLPNAMLAELCLVIALEVAKGIQHQGSPDDPKVAA